MTARTPWPMGRLHLWAGWITFVVFLATGQYMRSLHEPPVAELEQGTRMLVRSRHIYLLFAALLNLLIATKGSAGGPKWLTTLGAILLFLAPALLLAAFVLETTLFRSPTPLSIYGVQAALAGSLCYVVASRFGERT